VKAQHPSIAHVLGGDFGPQLADRDRNTVGLEQTTSPSLARALAIGCLSRLDPSLKAVNVWDPAVGTGFAGHMLVASLRAAGVDVQYRGQDIHAPTVSAAHRRFEGFPEIELAVGNTLEVDAHKNFRADLVIVDAPWGLSWTGSATAVEQRHRGGAFSFGLPQRNDSTWLFISLALEKIRPAAEGGGRVAALVTPSALSSGANNATVRQAILDAGLLESVTRLPEGLAPNTAVPLYLLTFTNSASRSAQNIAMIADLQAQFTTESGRRSIPLTALQELESGLRSGKPGPRNRRISTRHFTRRDAALQRTTGSGRRLSWRLTTFNDTPVDANFLESRYGLDSGVSLDGVPKQAVDLDPSRLFGDDSREILKDLDAKSWPDQRLTKLLVEEPEALKGNAESRRGNLFIPTTRSGVVSTTLSGTGADGRVISIQVDADAIQAEFLVSWLNSEHGVSSRRRAIDAGSTGAHLRALRSDTNSLMRWADELIIPVPPGHVQQTIAAADNRLASFQAELGRRRASIWVSPDNAKTIVDGIAGVFDDSLSSWLEQLPYPVATALWTAETADSLGDKQLAYMHAWEAIVTFHATVLLSACRSIPGSGSEVQAAIRRTLDENRIGIERATLGTWIVIAEKTSRVIRRALESEDRDEVARIRTAFGGLGQSGIARLASREVIKKFNELNTKRNRWNGHSGYTSDHARKLQIDALIADLRELRQVLDDVWTQLTLVRAGSVERGRDGYVQSVEVALGTKSPFRRNTYRVGDPMVAGDLYLVKDGSESPLQMLQFVQLRPAPRDAQYTTYFYNRTEGEHVRLVTYQHGAENDLQEAVTSFRGSFGELWEL
jgi:type I restriction enzyme M protein